MNQTEVNRFKKLYERHLRLLKLQGKSQKTIDAYSRAVRRISEHFDCCPDKLTPEQLETYFAKLVDSHSWSTVKIDRNGLQFYWRYVLKRDGCNTKKLQHEKNASNLKNYWTQIKNMYTMQGHGLAVKNTGAFCVRSKGR